MNRYLKLGDKYVDWYGRPATKTDYDLSHKEIPEILPIKPVELEEEPEMFPIPSDKLKGSGIPHVLLLNKNGIETISDIPKTISDLKDLNGIGKKSANDIGDWLWKYHEINVFVEDPGV